MRVLFLSTWYPYPLSQGSKIRAYHLLYALARRHDVALISFRDTTLEPSWLTHLQQFCHTVEVVDRDPFARRRLRTVLGRLSLKPTSIVAGFSQEMASRVKQVYSRWHPDVIVALTFVTAPYALNVHGMPRVIDVDNLMTRMLYEEYQRSSGLTTRGRHWLAWWKFQRFEKEVFAQFDLCLTVSDVDRQRLRALMPGFAGRIAIVPNGVDTAYHQYGICSPEPNTLVFNGALTYRPNFDAMDYFLSRIFPTIRSAIPEVKVRITGKTENIPLNRLPLDDHVIFTGFLEDIRPVVARSWACVAPLRVGGGTRLKILEAMALGTPVISTSKGAEGLDVVDGKHLLIADTPDEFAQQAVRLLARPDLRKTLSVNARRLVEEKYAWSNIGRRFSELVEAQSRQ